LITPASSSNPPPTIATIFLFQSNGAKRYAVATAVVALDRSTLKAKVIDSPEVIAVIHEVPSIFAHLFRQHTSAQLRT
jgi:hypothetical protein